MFTLFFNKSASPYLHVGIMWLLRFLRKPLSVTSVRSVRVVLTLRDCAPSQLDGGTPEGHVCSSSLVGFFSYVLGAAQKINPKGHLEPSARFWKYDCR